MTTPTTVNVRLQLRADTAANWTAANPTLLANEVGLETDTKKLKVGNGSSAWNSLAYFPSIVSGGTVLGNLEIGSTGTLTFEGSTADGFETTLAVTNPTADRTITLPNQSGTVVVSGNASIVDADIAANAEIAVSKLADGSARQLLQTDAAGTGVEWTSNIDIPGSLDVTGPATFDGAVIVGGDLTVNGTTTNINTQNLVVEDKNIILGDVATPTDVTADGGGITLKGATDKTINWVDSTDAWTSSERFSVPLGSAASPSLTFTGDENSGVYSPGADQVAISTGGSGRLFVDANGNISVNLTTSNLISKLGVGAADANNSLASSAAGISIVNTNSSAFNRTGVLTFGQGAYGDAQALASVAGVYTNYTTSVGGALVFSTNNGSGGFGERLRITSAGLVGVGTSSPVAKFQINAQDGFRFDVGANAYSYMQFGSANAGEATGEIGFERTSGNIYIKRGAPGSPSTALTIDANSRVGIGTTSPADPLHVVGRIRGVATNFALQARDTGSSQTSIGLTVEGLAADKKSWEFLNDASGNFQIRTINDAYTSSQPALFVARGASAASVDHIYLATAGTERARIDSSGRLLVGTSSAPAPVAGFGSNAIQVVNQSAYAGIVNLSTSNDAFGPHFSFGKSRGGTSTIVQNNDNLGSIRWAAADGTDVDTAAALIEAYVDGTPGANDMPGRLVFSTTADGASSPTERMRINSSGQTGIFCSAANTFYVSSSGAASASDISIIALHSAVGMYTGTASFVVRTNGNVQNANNSYGAISDAKLKENIVDATSQWSDIKALQVRNYNFKEGQTHTQIGLIAQEVELVSPGLVSESPDRDAEGNDLGTVTKSVNYSVLYMKAVKALQEAMERIELLEARLDAANL